MLPCEMLTKLKVCLLHLHRNQGLNPAQTFILLLLIFYLKLNQLLNIKVMN